MSDRLPDSKPGEGCQWHEKWKRVSTWDKGVAAPYKICATCGGYFGEHYVDEVVCPCSAIPKKNLLSRVIKMPAHRQATPEVKKVIEEAVKALEDVD